MDSNFEVYENLFYKRLTELRIKKGVSAQKMSEAIGQGRSYINNLENKHGLPSMSGFFYICDYLSITPCEFFDEGNHHPQEIKKLANDLLSLNQEELSTVASLVEMIKKKR